MTGTDADRLSVDDAAEAKPQVGNQRSARNRARGRLDAARGRYEASWAADLVTLLKALRLGEWTTVFGAELLWSVLPLVILLSSLASERVDDDLSRHIGASGQGAHIIRELFRNTPTFAVVPVVTGIVFAFVGTITVVRSMQVLYERAFEQSPRGWRDIPRFLVWLLVLLGALVLEGIVDKPVRSATGIVIDGLVRLLGAMLFFWWTMHFLLKGRVPWGALIRPAFVTAILWIALAVFSSISLSSNIVSDSKLYGTIGVIFTLLTWFILVAGVLVFGAALGAVWQTRRGRGFGSADPGAPPSKTGAGRRQPG